MPRVPLHALIWSRDQGCYALYMQDRLVQQVQSGDEAAWLAWLRKVSSFAFHGASGSLNVYLEARSPGGQYWYGSHTSRGRTRKRYLGRTENLTLTHLEETARALLREQRAATDQGMVLLSGRLSPPRLPNALVERERLLATLDEALATPLTLLSAPAGFGKTTLLATWASRRPIRVAWLSLDELDNSPTRFWVALITALRRGTHAAADLGQTAVTLLQSPQPLPLVACLSALLQELESHEAHAAPLVLMVDDYQVIEELTIHESLSFFLEHLPAHLHLILSSRVDPDLPLARLRAYGQLTEIRAADLRFQEGEANHYLGHMLSPPLSEEEVQRLVNRTEGWIAGLQLARQAPGSHQPHPGACPGACPLPALTRFLPTGGLPPHTTTPFGILLTTVEWLAFCYAFPRAVLRNGDLPWFAFPSTARRLETRRMRRRQMYYAIRVQGHLSPSWQDRFGGLCIEQQEIGATQLSGTLPDQAALHGVLLQIVRLGLTLLSLETSEAPNEIGNDL